MSAHASGKKEDRPRGCRIAQYVHGTTERDYPPHVIKAAKYALIDFVGVAVGAYDDEPVRPVRQLVASWNAEGRAQVFMGGRTSPAFAVLVNGTMGHAMDFDDAHTMGAGHISVPCGSTAFAYASHLGFSEMDTLKAFITGFEVTARLGGGGESGVGRNLPRTGFHPTGVLCRFGAAAVAGALLKLTESQIEHAMGIAATTAAGLLGSFGTHSKPLHAGKGAMDGIMSAELAARGFEAATDLLEIGNGGMLDALIQDRNAIVPPLDFENWEILRNGYKPFASGRASHAVAQAACDLAERVKGRTIAKVRAKVHTNAGLTMGNAQPRTPLEGKFSVAFCIALGLRGYKLAATDFSEATMRDHSVMGLLPLIDVEVVASQAAHEAHLEVTLDDGAVHHADTSMVLGHPSNPMSPENFQAKFHGLVDPVIGAANARRLFNALENFEQPGRMQEIVGLLGEKRK